MYCTSQYGQKDLLLLLKLHCDLKIYINITHTWTYVHPNVMQKQILLTNALL